MAKKDTAQPARRRRRTPEERIADLQKEIEAVKARAAARESKQSASVRMSVSIVRNLDKALDLAKEEDQAVLRHALADARKPLAAFLTSKGIQLPKARAPRGRKPKGYGELSEEPDED